ncbi:hypothetical protein IWX76_003178 [Pedobacter sp. CAN_A7]|uniref:hypothetical protein n=1 Tax=Pedobacter sp. CAN_A7 TaxID=2787722 RepID=UPI0018C99AC5
MISFFILFILLFGVNQVLLNSLAQKHRFFDKKLLNLLYGYHLLFFLVYFLYATYNPSDSKHYYAVADALGSDWPSRFQTGTQFVNVLAAPFIQLGLSFIATMLLFSWMGYVGFVYAYLFFRENIPVPVKLFGRFDLLTVLLFLPNMHFWTASLGKGSVIFMGLMLFTYAVKFPSKRIIPLLIGGFFIYMVRPHVMFFVLLGVMTGLMIGEGKISTSIKIFIIIASLGFLVVFSSSILAVANLQDSENVIEDFGTFSQKRASGLSTSGSGVNMSNYPVPVKLFTFWFRPLFVDSPGVLGLFSSVENLLYLLLFFKICNKRFFRFMKKAPYLVIMSAIIFLLASFAMTFIMSNLGIMMRQKSMVMYFGFFVIYYFLAEERYQAVMRIRKRKEQMKPKLTV